jgi:hypothetical protein
VISEIDIWRAAQLMLTSHGNEAQAKSASRADQFTAAGDAADAAVWRRITCAISHLQNMMPVGPLH